jgi:hypothetical protein
LIAEAAKRGEVDLSLVSVDSTTARAHHDAAGVHLGQDVVTAFSKAAAEEKKAPESYLADLHLRAAMIWIKDLTRATP